MDQKQEEKRVDPLTLPVPENLPILPLHGFVFFPGMGFPLQVASDSSKQLIDEALLAGRMIGLVANRQEKSEQEQEASDIDLNRIGVVGYIHKMTKADEGYYQVLVSGLKKIQVAEITQREPYIRARVDEVPMEMIEDQKIDALVLNIRNQFQNLVKLTQLPPEMAVTVNAMVNHFHAAYMVISQLNLRWRRSRNCWKFGPWISCSTPRPVS